MNDMLFEEVRSLVAQWAKDIEESMKKWNVEAEMVTNTKDCLYIIFNFGECMAAIVVGKPTFAPYRFVSFESYAIVDGGPAMVYAWYDGERTNLNEIIENLDRAIRVALQYSGKMPR